MRVKKCEKMEREEAENVHTWPYRLLLKQYILMVIDTSLLAIKAYLHLSFYAVERILIVYHFRKRQRGRR